jgi:hypothetical protein
LEKKISGSRIEPHRGSKPEGISATVMPEGGSRRNTAEREPRVEFSFINHTSKSLSSINFDLIRPAKGSSTADQEAFAKAVS